LADRHGLGLPKHAARSSFFLLGLSLLLLFNDNSYLRSSKFAIAMTSQPAVAQPQDTPRSRTTLLVGLTIAVVLLLASLLIIELQRSHQREIKNAEALTSSINRVLEKELLASVGKIDLIIQEAVFDYENHLNGDGDASPGEMNPTLKRLLDRLPGVLSLRITREDGSYVFDASGQVSTANIADREYFRVHQAGKTGKLFAEGPIFSRVANVWLITFSRGVYDKDGTFRGIVQASIPSEWLAEAFAGVSLEQSDVVTLINTDMVLIARNPQAPEQFGKPIEAEMLATRIKANPESGNYSAFSSIDGERRIYHYQHVAGLPLYLISGVSHQRALSEWRRTAIVYSTVALLLLAGGVALVFKTYRRVEASRARQAFRYKELLRTSTDGIHIVDQDGNLREASDSFYRMLGHEPDSAGAMHVRDWDVGLDNQDIKAAIQERIDHAAIYETLYRTRDGRLIDVETSVHGIEMDGEKLLYCSARDITERIASKRLLARAEQYAELIINSVGEGLCHIDLDGAITFINPVGAELLGYRPEEVIGQASHPLFHHTRADGSPYPESECRVREASRCMHTQRVSDEVFWRKDGSSFPVHFVAAPIVEAGHSVGVVLTFRDVSEELRTQKILVENEVKMRKAQEIAGFGSYMTDLSTGIWESTPQLDAIFGIDEHFHHDIPNWNQLILPEYRQAALDHYLLVAREGREFRMDYQIARLSDGVHRWVAANGELEYDAQGNPARLIGTIQDITERIEAQTQLSQLNASLETRVAQRTSELAMALDNAEQAKRSRGEFLAKMSHEIRTPMNAVLGMTYLALKSNPDPRQRSYLEKIQLSGEHLLGIINDILDFSKIDAGKLKIETENFDLDRVIENIQHLTEGKAQDKGLALRLDIDPAIPRKLKGDALRLGQILINYTNNAIKFTENGSVTLRARALVPGGNENGLTLRFEVQDSGIGMTEEQQSRLFRSFEQADNSTTRRFGGTGLGLAISRELTILMGGEIGVSSAPGAGSIFWFTVPLQLADDMAPARLAEPGEIPSHHADPLAMLHGARILLVDDNELNQEVAQGILEEVGMTVRIAANGVEALECLAKEHFDCVLMDIQMPLMDGLEATRIIRADPALAGICIIAMTANARGEDRDECLTAGMNDFVTKPFDPMRLYTKLANCLHPEVLPVPDEPVQYESAPTGDVAHVAAIDQLNLTTLRTLAKDDPAKITRFCQVFLDSLNKNMTELAAALNAADFKALAFVAHRTKSAARSFGAAGLADLSQIVESTITNGDFSTASDSARQMIQAHARITEQITSEMARCAREIAR
jgi:PAS domain S-box-containing protein